MKFAGISILALAVAPNGVTGFSTSLQSPSSCGYCIASRDYRLRMSSEEEEEEGSADIDDALAKLIGKRDEIIKKKPENKPKSPVIPPDDLMEELKEPLSDKTGMDIFEMPEFKTKRPLRTSKPTDDADEKEGASAKDDLLFIDYQAEYEDENDLHIPNRIGFGTMAWGDPDAGFKAGTKLKKKEKKRGKFLAGDLQLAYNKLTEAGVTFVDTSENYGLSSRKDKLSSEEIIGTILEENTVSVPIVASTMSNPWKSLRQGTGARIGRSAILKAIEASCERMGTSAIDLYQVPSNMFYLGAPGVVADALCMAMDQGLINNIGVCNMGKTQMKSFAKKLRKRGYDLTSNQFEFSLTNRKAYKSGLIAACKQLGVIPIAHTPLGGGLATGLYTATNPTGGLVTGIAPFDFKTLDKFSSLHNVLETVSTSVTKRLEKEAKDNQDRYKARYRGAPDTNTSASTTQVALNYVVAKGCVPVPGIKNPKEAEELLGCLGWALTDEEVKMLDDAADLSASGVKV